MGLLWCLLSLSYLICVDLIFGPGAHEVEEPLPTPVHPPKSRSAGRAFHSASGARVPVSYAAAGSPRSKPSTKTEQLKLFDSPVAARFIPRPHACNDCSRSVYDEYYMVHHDVWPLAVAEALEERQL